jgi:SAM-dependent methyltransferase
MKPEDITPGQIKSIEEAGYKYHFDKEDFDEEHPLGLHNEICSWAAQRIKNENVFDVLDIASYLDFVSGMACGLEVTMLDNRKVKLKQSGINHVVGDAKKLPFEDESFDLVTSLSVIEHIGTGAFGDDLDVEADEKMIQEVHRVLRKGGHFVFSTQIAEEPVFIVNCHRLYTKEFLMNKLNGFLPRQGTIIQKQGDKSRFNHWDAICIHCQKV